MFADLFASLPAAGKDGTLKDRFKGQDSEWLVGRLRGKTGTLTEPVIAVGLAGYSRTRKGRFTAFSLVVNGSSKAGKRSVFGVQAVRNAMEKDLTRILGKN